MSTPDRRKRLSYLTESTGCEAGVFSGAQMYNDNGLVESKNGAVVRKHMRYEHIAGAHAGAVEGFYEEHFNPYLNYHRPCGVPETQVNGKGKQKRVYRGD